MCNLGENGSGKSSLFITLLRLYDIQSGEILIDDVDISRISLEDLRNKICIIPVRINTNKNPFILNIYIIYP